MLRRKIRNIIIHTSDSKWGNVNEIRRWHLERGFRDIGYHFVISNGRITRGLNIPTLDGSIECGRPLNEDMFLEGNEIGAHAMGYNRQSIGICLVGKGGQFSPFQRISLIRLLRDLIELYKIPIDNILGHRETEGGRGKTCPDFDVALTRKTLMSQS